MSVLRTEKIVKQYPGCLALNNVTVSFESGKVNALLGKNGSGKTTLVKCFSGAIQPTSGSFYLDDEKLHFHSTAEANARGFATVYQEMSLIPSLSVAENIFLGRMPKKGKIIDWKKANEEAEALLNKMGVKINPKEIVSRLSMWQCQVIEITKAMSYNPKVLMLDEPTSSLASNEVESLFNVIRELKKQDIIILYISHKLHEVPQITDTITVLRDGYCVGKVNTKDVNHADILKMMFGETKQRNRPDDVEAQDETVMEIKNLTRKNKFSNINFKLHKGEILGIAGMLGAGRTELLKSIFGADPYDSGEIHVGGQKAPRRASPISMKKLGLGLTPENRKEEGLILIHSILDNLCYASMNRTSNGWLENRQKRKSAANKQVQELDIKITDMASPANSLSGGNQQKVVVGNWLNTQPEIMLYDEPTRGIDVNAKQQIFEIMWEQSKRGISIIFVSSELEELLEVCHRILIMKEGRLIGEVRPEDVDTNQLYALSMGDEIA
ncbi:MAG TPA: sugar ABC transporter ATP-binding protein [Clostridiaceae bacterium]|jgi:ribose transport system ATP-binding protein|nr:sugar ABC transporter ATP-binding protein [Clostridiaceae bacterium]